VGVRYISELIARIRSGNLAKMTLMLASRGVNPGKHDHARRLHPPSPDHDDGDAGGVMEDLDQMLLDSGVELEIRGPEHENVG
jgi:hypothetical protein